MGHCSPIEKQGFGTYQVGKKSNRTARPPPTNTPSSFSPTAGPDCSLSTLSLRQTIGPPPPTVNPTAVPLRHPMSFTCSADLVFTGWTGVCDQYLLNRTRRYPLPSTSLVNLSPSFSLTFVIRLVQYNLEKSLVCLRGPFPLFLEPQVPLIVATKQPRTVPFRINHL